MNSPDRDDQHDAQLKAAAEARLASSPMAETSGRPVEDLLHQLQVHKIELEMQNAALRQSQIALEESRARYIDFYDLSPVGYITLTDKGLIEEINLTGAAMLGMDRATLLHRRFSPSVAPQDRDRWFRHFISALRQDGKLNCDVALLRPDASLLDVRLDTLRLAKGDELPMLRVVLTDIGDRKRVEEQLREMAASLEAKVAERTRQLRRLAGQLTMVEERERHLLAQDLHDNLGQLLAAIKIRLTALAGASLQPTVDQIVELVDKAEQSARAVSRQLSPPMLHSLGFLPALEWLAEEMEQVFGIAVDIDRGGDLKPIADEILAVLYRSTRELLINVVKHARTQNASLTCLSDAGRLTLVVSDDGCGFDSRGFPNALSENHSFGLRSIYERITNLGGEMEIDSNPGSGTTVSLAMPYSFVDRRIPS